MKINTTIILIIAIFNCTIVQSQPPKQDPNDPKMDWYKEARYGMFIHWGVYSKLAGYWNDKPITNMGEWIMSTAKIPLKDYQATFKDFDPVKFNADEWVKTIKDVSMKYLVITAKHHNGFAM